MKMTHAGSADAEQGVVESASTLGVDSPLFGELLGLLAHDLRNPLSALHSNLGFLDGVLSPGNEDAREAIDDGLVSCDGLSHVIDNVDLLGQVLRRNVPVSRSPSPAAGLVASAVERCQSAARSHGLQLQLSPDVRRLHAVVEVSRDLAAGALSNLIRNSVQHAPSGSTVVVSAQLEPREVCVSVRDGGPAFGADNRFRAFTAAGQVEAKSRVHSRYSRGMGLFCAKLAAELCGASVEATSQPDGGNLFELRLPLIRPAG